MESAKRVVPLVLEYLNPKSVVEVGCGEGVWLREFQDTGVRILGLDDEKYGQTEFWMGNKASFQPVNMDRVRLTCSNKFDLAICMEVAHRYAEDRAKEFVHDLCLLSDVVLFSAAIPGQEEDAVNGQMPSYWAELFRQNGFMMLDCIRPRIWEDEGIDVRYRQNVVFFLRAESVAKYPYLLKFHIMHENNMLHNVVHYVNWEKVIKDKIRLAEELKKFKPQKVLYTFYHGAIFGWVLTHKLTKHPKDEAWLLLGSNKARTFWAGAKKPVESLSKFVELGVFKGIYTYDTTIGMDASNVEEVEKSITDGIGEMLNEQGCDIKSFDNIYSSTDTIDTLGIFLSMMKVKFTFVELVPNYFFKRKKENIIAKENNNKPAYKDALLKHKTLLGENEYQSMILYPNSKNIFPSDRSSFFDPSQAASRLSNVDKLIVSQGFNLDKIEQKQPSAWIMLLSYGITQIITWPIVCKVFPNRYKHIEHLYWFNTQILLEYFIPDDCTPILKCHPVPSIFDSNIMTKYFSGINAYPQFFTMPLVSMLPKKYIPKYAVTLGQAAPSQLPPSTIQIPANGAWLFSFFLHKYFTVMCLLNYFDCLYKNVGEKFESIGERGARNTYNDILLRQTIDSLILIHFPESGDLCTINYRILQQPYHIVSEKMVECKFFLCTDIWEEMTIETISAIRKNYDIGIIRLRKNPVKKMEDILAPLHNEYIFFFSKDESCLEKLRKFSFSKTNKIMGIELTAEIISLEEYVLEHGDA